METLSLNHKAPRPKSHQKWLEVPLQNIRFAMVQDCIRSTEFHRPAHFLLLNYTAQATSSVVTLNEEATEYVWVDPQQARRMTLNQPTRRLLDHIHPPA